MKNKIQKTTRARELRKTETKSEKLLWSLLRAKQLCGLKFRRQHPIGPFFADFACKAKMLVVEVDGGYHDYVGEEDLEREAFLRKAGWDVFRVTDKDVEDDPEAVAIGIARHLELEFEFSRRGGTGSGMESLRAPNMRRGKPSPAATASDPPEGRVSDG